MTNCILYCIIKRNNIQGVGYEKNSKIICIIMVIVLAGCSNTETQEPPRQRTTGEKVALVTSLL